MSHLEEHISIACPLAQAAMRLRQFFGEHESPDPEATKLTLEADVNVPGRATPVTLQRSVIATITPHHLPADMSPRYRVVWAPEIPGPFPSFEGELLVGGNDDYNTFTLRLSGDYTPPLGLLGKGFDVVFGNHVAHATAHDLLRRIGDRIEREFGADEARKHPAAEPEP